MIEIHKKKCTLSDMSVGDMFLYDGELFMCIKPIRISDTKSYNAVSLETGLAVEMNLCENVRLCKLNIECAAS